MMKKNIETYTILIKDKNNNPKKLNISDFYNLVCSNVVSKFFYIYRQYLTAYGLELNDLRQELLLTIINIVNYKDKINKIPKEKVGGYLLNSVKWKLNNILSKAVTAYKYSIGNSEFLLEKLINEEDSEINSSERILQLFADDNKINIKEILINVCTEKEAKIIYEYYYNKQNTNEIAKVYSITPQRVSAIIKEALVKLNYYLKQFLNTKEDYDKKDY